MDFRFGVFGYSRREREGGWVSPVSLIEAVTKRQSGWCTWDGRIELDVTRFPDQIDFPRWTAGGHKT